MYIGKSRKDLARSDFQKVKAERLSSMPGLEDIRPAIGQSNEQFAKDLDRIASVASEQMAAANERRQRLREKQRKPSKMLSADKYSKIVSDRERCEYEKRAISL